MIGIIASAAVYLVVLGKWPMALMVPVLLAIVLRTSHRTTALVTGLAIVAAIWIQTAQPASLPDQVDTIDAWHLKVTSVSQQRNNGWDFVAEVQDGPVAGTRLLIHSTDPTPPPNRSYIHIRGTAIPATEDGTVFRRVTSLGASGEIYTSEVIIVPGEPASFTDRIHNRASAWRLDVIRQIQIAIPGDSGALVAGFVTGDDGHLSAAGDATFRAAGLSHLTAVSGANLAMLLSMIGIAGHLGRRGRYSIAIAGVVILWGYALFVGLPPPTLRAALLATAVGIARLLGRPVDVIGLSLFTVVAQIAIRPEDAWSVSFHLSTAASLGLAAGLSRYPMVDDARNVGDLFSATALAQLTTLPIIVGVFGTAPLFSLFANIAAAPFAGFSFALGVFGAATSMVSRDLGTILLIPAGWSAEIVLGIASLYGRAWSVLSFREWPEPVIVLMTIVVLLLTLAIGGELSLLRRQFANERSIRADSS